MLLERDRELGLLDRLVQSTLAGEAGLALLEGPAGIGKSSLLAKAREKAASAGFRVVAARGSDLERELPYGVGGANLEGADIAGADVTGVQWALTTCPDGVRRTRRAHRWSG